MPTSTTPPVVILAYEQKELSSADPSALKCTNFNVKFRQLSGELYTN